MALTQADIVEKRIVSLEKIRNIGIIAHIDAGKYFEIENEEILFYIKVN